MASVPRQNTSIEVALAKAIHAEGLRYRKHVKGLPGTPDIVFTRAKIAVFVDGDFWHGYRFKKLEPTLKPFWRDKIVANRARDLRNFLALRKMGWQVIRVWQHDIEKNLPVVVERIRRSWEKRNGRAKAEIRND